MLYFENTNLAKVEFELGSLGPLAGMLPIKPTLFVTKLYLNSSLYGFDYGTNSSFRTDTVNSLGEHQDNNFEKQRFRKINNLCLNFFLKKWIKIVIHEISGYRLKLLKNLSKLKITIYIKSV